MAGRWDWRGKREGVRACDCCLFAIEVFTNNGTDADKHTHIHRHIYRYSFSSLNPFFVFFDLSSYTSTVLSNLDFALLTLYLDFLLCSFVCSGLLMAKKGGRQIALSPYPPLPPPPLLNRLILRLLKNTLQHNFKQFAPFQRLYIIKSSNYTHTHTHHTHTSRHNHNRTDKDTTNHFSCFTPAFFSNK